MTDDSSDSKGTGAARDDATREERVATFIRNSDASPDGTSDSAAGAGDEEPERRQTTIYLDADVKRKLKAYCSLEEIEMSQLVNDLVAEELEGWSPDL